MDNARNKKPKNKGLILTVVLLVSIVGIVLICLFSKYQQKKAQEEETMRMITPENVSQAMDDMSMLEVMEWLKEYLRENKVQNEPCYTDLTVHIPQETEKIIDNDTCEFIAEYDTPYRDDYYIYGKEIVYTIAKDRDINRFLVTTKEKRLGTDDEYTEGKPFQIIFASNLTDLQVVEDVVVTKN